MTKTFHDGLMRTICFKVYNDSTVKSDNNKKKKEKTLVSIESHSLIFFLFRFILNSDLIFCLDCLFEKTVFFFCFGFS